MQALTPEHMQVLRDYDEAAARNTMAHKSLMDVFNAYADALNSHLGDQ